MKRITTIILAALTTVTVSAQQDIKNKLEDYFKGYRATGQRVRSNAHLKSLEVNDSLRTIEVCADTHLGENCFSPDAVDDIYNNVRGLMPDSCQDYQLSIKTGGWELRQLVPPRLLRTPDPARSWGDINYEGKPRTVISVYGRVMAPISISPIASGNGSVPHSSERVRICLPRPSSYLI